VSHATQALPEKPQAVAVMVVSQLRSARQHPKRQFKLSHRVKTHVPPMHA
jgi:hypothetical protein